MPLDPTPAALRDDPEMASLGLALATAGSGARAAERTEPTPAFASKLRSQLLEQLSAADDRTRLVDDRTRAVADDRTRLADDRTRAAADDRTRAVADERTAVWPVSALIESRLPSLLPARRSLAFAMAAVVLVGLLGAGALRVLPTALDARVVTAAGAVLVRDGSTTALTTGTALREGDVVRVASDGAGTLAIDRGETRLAGGAELRIVALERDAVSLEQLAGRVWHRVAVPQGATYSVITGPVEWSALGTAFDLERGSRPEGSDVVHALGIEHAVGVAGPGLSAKVEAGREATVILAVSGAGPDISVGALGAAILADPWLVENARRDVTLGFDPGVLTKTDALPSASPEPSAVPSSAADPSPAASPLPEPSPSPDPSVDPSPTPKPSPTPEPTPKATPTPTPKPSAVVGSLSLSLRSCPGGIVLDWSPSKSEAFDHYTVVRHTASFETPKSYPPEPPVVALDDTYTTDPSVTSSGDVDLDAGNAYWYRALAFDGEDRVIATSALRSATAKPVRSLGALDTAPAAGQVEVGWSPYGGSEKCFTYYKVVWSDSTKTPSYLGENDGAIPMGNQSDASLTVAELDAGTYWFRVQAIRVTELGKFIVAETSVAKVVVP